MKKLKFDKRKRAKLKLVLAMSAIVFCLISVSSFCFFSVYTIINKVPFLDIEKLPRHSGTYILGTISIILGVLLSLVFRKYILIPLHNSYVALEKVADGDFSVNVHEKGIGSVRRVTKGVNIMARELKNIETMRSDFINNFSHEFKTPIISIMGFAKMLKNSDLSPEEKEEYLDIIISESERLSQLSTNVLNLTRLDNQCIVPKLSEFNVTEQIRHAVILLEQKWAEKNITVSINGDDYTIYAGEELLNQLWINLIDNAIKFSPAFSEVSISVTKKENMLVFTVADSGAGMNENEIRHAFDRFFQGDLAHKTSGYGIGLSISKRICELHGGSIQIKSSDSNGTVFEIILPE